MQNELNDCYNHKSFVIVISNYGLQTRINDSIYYKITLHVVSLMWVVVDKLLYYIKDSIVYLIYNITINYITYLWLPRNHPQ